MSSSEKIARILRADKDTILKTAEIMTELSGHSDVLDRILEKNEKAINERLNILKVKSRQSREIYNALLDKIRDDDQKLSQVLGHPVCISNEGCKGLIDAVKTIIKARSGLFLKLDKAREFLIKKPPLNLLKILGCSSVEEMLNQEDIFEIYSALRFVENKEWLNNVFFKQYEQLNSDDFEEREIKLIVLSRKWESLAERFVRKKYHNISHLKELGIIFILPATLNIEGETLRTLSLVLHYFHEINFYSNLFRSYLNKEDFGLKFISLLKGDILDKRFPEEDLGRKWMIIQRYLAKDDPNDWRLFEPHLNSETLHWRKAENDLCSLKEFYEDLDLSFWKGIDYVGDFYPTETGVDILVSFNLIDTVMSLVKKQEMVKYLYHHQEALWSEIFQEFIGEEKTEQLIIKNFAKGFIDLGKLNN